MYIHEFAIGMGPVIYRRQGAETKYTVRLIPIGGFNRFAGEEGKDRDEDVVVPHNRLITSQSPGRRAMIMAAGPAANLLIAAIAFMAVFSFVGLNTPTTTISEVMAGYPAESAGLLAGDIVTAIGGVKTPTWQDMTKAVQPRADQPTEVSFQRGYESIVTLTFNVNGVGVIGVRCPSW